MKITHVLLALCALAAPAAFAQGALVVNTGNSLNCVTAQGETGFNIQSWAIGGSSNISLTTLQYGKLALSDIIINKTVDACSGQLQQKFLYAQDLPSFTLTQYSPSSTGQNLPILLVTLTKPIMNSYSISGATTTQPTEAIAITFSKVCIKEWKQNPDGTFTPQPQLCYTPSTQTISSN